METLAWSSESGDDPVRDLTGTTLGDFQVNRLLGRGGMGQVYLATQISLNRPVAIKMIHAGRAHEEKLRQRLAAEGQVLARQRHPDRR